MGNMTPADRQRIKQEAADRRKAQENKVFFILTAITVAIFAVVLLYRPVVNFFTLPAEIHNLSSIQDDWVVIDADNTTGTLYHHPATFPAPEGYTLSSFYTSEELVTQDIYLVADDPEADVAIIYVFAAPELTAQENIARYREMYGDALNAGDSVVLGEPFTATIAGEKALCIYMRYSTAVGDYGCLVCSFDAPRNVCVTASLSGKYAEAGQAQTQEELLAQAQTLLADLTIVK